MDGEAAPEEHLEEPSVRRDREYRRLYPLRAAEVDRLPRVDLKVAHLVEEKLVERHVEGRASGRDEPVATS